MSQPDYERLLQLIADQATEGLDLEGQKELQDLMSHYPQSDPTEVELAAAAALLASIQIDEPLPAHLQRQILAKSEEFFASTSQPVAAQVVPLVRPRLAGWQWAGWYAAAASLALALFLTWVHLRPQPLIPSSQPLAAKDVRELLIQKNADTLVLPWQGVMLSADVKVSGDVVWNTDVQKGFMRFQGLPVNDPKVSVYQLWIFDATRDDRFPVDGGVFNVDSTTGEVLVQIDPKLYVNKPTLFAVTIEPPGGVVVSKRDKLILAARVT